jgi:hypothetical protein
MSEHAGSVFEQTWIGRTAYDLFEQIRSTMPMDDPGRMSREEYADIVAYLFRINGFPAGAAPLSSESGPLRQIRIETAADSSGAGSAGRGEGTPRSR